MHVADGNDALGRLDVADIDAALRGPRGSDQGNQGQRSQDQPGTQESESHGASIVAERPLFTRRHGGCTETRKEIPDRVW